MAELSAQHQVMKDCIESLSRTILRWKPGDCCPIFGVSGRMVVELWLSKVVVGVRGGASLCLLRCQH